LQGGEEREDLFEIGTADIHHQADLALGSETALEHEGEVFEFFADPGIGPTLFIGDEAGGTFKKFVDDAKVVGTEGAAGFGNFDDGVGELWGFDFGGSPGEFDIHGDAAFGEVVFGEVDDFGGDAFSGEVFGLLNGGVVGNAEDPADGFAADFGEHQFADFMDIGFVFEDPVVAGDPGIENALLNIAGHFLSADEEALDFDIVDFGVVGAGGELDVVTGFAEEFTGGFLE